MRRRRFSTPNRSWKSQAAATKGPRRFRTAPAPRTPRPWQGAARHLRLRVLRQEPPARVRQPARPAHHRQGAVDNALTPARGRHPPDVAGVVGDLDSPPSRPTTRSPPTPSARREPHRPPIRVTVIDTAPESSASRSRTSSDGCSTAPSSIASKCPEGSRASASPPPGCTASSPPAGPWSSTPGPMRASPRTTSSWR